MPDYEPVIGLEVHAQLRTRSKMFCSCPADYQAAPPNTRVCPVCLGLPGTLPVINREAIRSIIMTGLALHCEIAQETKFDRKNYAYPDLMKGYQISQYDLPICHDGYLEIDVDGERRRIGIERVHMEEDVAKLFHRVDPATGEGYSLVDVNRSGVPLMEMVGRPDLRSAEEARAYLIAYRSILQYLGVSTGSMEEGSFRCDANVSLRLRGASALGTKVEVKNMNSFRAVYRAILFEIERQSAKLDRGERISMETRGWVEEKGITVSLRSKEEANDYRYFPEPDLPPLHVEPSWVAELEELLPELPEARRARFMAAEDAKGYGLSEYDASGLTDTPALADYFEEAVGAVREGHGGDEAPKRVANWMLSELASHLNAANAVIDDSPVRPGDLAGLLGLLAGGTVGTTQAKAALEAMYESGKPAAQVVEELGLAQVTDSGELTGAVRQAIAENPSAVADFLGGKETAAKFLVGQVMKATRGKANPGIVAELVAEQLGALKQ